MLPAQLVARHRNIHLLGIGQLELSHDEDKFLQTLIQPEPGIARFLLRDAGNAATMVVVRRVDQRLISPASTCR